MSDQGPYWLDESQLGFIVGYCVSRYCRDHGDDFDFSLPGVQALSQSLLDALRMLDLDFQKEAMDEIRRLTEGSS